MTVYEYRVTWQGVRHPEMRRESDRFRTDDPMWANWTYTSEDEADDEFFADVGQGIDGILEATRRELAADGKLGLRVERREVGDWEIVTPALQRQQPPTEGTT